MTHQFINTLKDQTDVNSVYRVANKQLRPNRNGDLYLQIDMYDKTGTITARIWNAGESLYKSFDCGDYLHIDGKSQVFQGTVQMIGKKIYRAGSEMYNEEDYVRLAEVNISRLLARVRELTNTIQTPSLKNLIDCILMDAEFMARFCDAPAGVKNHHAYKGGLLEHTVGVLELADRVASLYKESINRDLMLTGAFVHDLSKTDEIIFDTEITYSDEGQMIGHLVMGVEKLNEMIVQSEKLSGETMDPELKMRLKHMILSHHGEYEFGSPKLPMTTEAIALHYIDCLDSKIVGFAQLIKDDMNGDSSWTCFVPNLQRKIYKGKPEKPEEDS